LESNLKTFKYKNIFTVQGSAGNVATEEQGPLCKKTSRVKVDLPKHVRDQVVLWEVCCPLCCLNLVNEEMLHS